MSGLIKGEEDDIIEESMENIELENMTNDHSFNEIKQNAINEGFSKKDITTELEKKFNQQTWSQKATQLNLGKLFSKKEVLDRVGYGFAAHQYIIIFLFLTGAPIFLVGMLNAFRDVLTVLFSSFIREYMEFRKIKNSLISTAGIAFGFTFFIIAFAIKAKMVWLFSMAFLIGSIGIVTYGELYGRLLENTLKHEKRSTFLKFILNKGLILTSICFFLSGIILQYFGLRGKVVRLLILDHSYTFAVNGYILVFEIAALAFILSGHLLSKLPSVMTVPRVPTQSILKNYIFNLKLNYRQFLGNKRIKLMLVSSTLIGVIQSLGTAYYGWFIYYRFKDLFFGGFINVAVIFSFAILISFLGPSFAKMFRQHLGLTPMFVFGTLLIGLLPLTLVYNPHFLTILFSNSIAVIGASILGVAQGLLARKLLNEYERKIYFHALGVSSALPFLILIPLGALIGHFYGLALLFKVMVLVLLFIITPINLRLVMMTEKQKV